MRIEIRREIPADVPAISALTISAFSNPPHSGHNEERIVSALRDAGELSVSLVAVEDENVIGHVAVSPVTISDGASGWCGLGPISVAPKHQRSGVGSRLVLEALRILGESGAAGCVVLGDPAFYGRFGFQAAPSLILPGVPPEYFQSLPLGSPRAHGTVAYRPAFTQTSSHP